MRVVPSVRGSFGKVRRRIIIPSSQEFGISGLVRIGGNGSNTWYGADLPLAIPFRLSEVAIVDQLGWFTGTSTGSTNVDIGIYDAAWNRKTSAGSTAHAGTSQWQFVDVTNVTLQPNVTYYVVLVVDGLTTNRIRFHSIGGSTLGMQLGGVKDSATSAFPLPDPLTNMVDAATAVLVPIVAVAFKAPF